MNLLHTVRSLVLGMPKLVSGGRPGERAGAERLASVILEAQDASPLVLISPAFTAGSTLPTRYSVEGASESPPLRWGRPPRGTQSFALVVEDPDAPTINPFVHWLVADLEPSRMELSEGIPAEGADYLVQGKNSMLREGFTGAAPPKGDDPHRYVFQLFALDKRLGLEPGFGREALFKAMRGHIIGYGETTALFAR